ncbi:permease [Carboxydothermus hydrogenoformans]|uniref:Permease family protein n=1 Tax=Carboxydothermus hydrogenoformans (strain ATCC BAA-161 / DSM 6008 / Z-2901) TaxID=246194 RepID=Q3AD41_CARHZ|nr:permease [Carboxydothermus hydrogenoformans]ABB14640.1 permease family protein [Carboxydothermus hydrogenoformans Z-2901]
MLNSFADLVTYRLFGLEKGSALGEAVHFFIYDTIKIFLLLAVIIFVVSYLRSYITPEKTRKVLSGRFGFLGNILAALFGTVTPFCSCSAVPLFIGFVEAGVPLGVTFSYLVSAPMVNEVALVMLLGMFGVKVALIYVASGLVIAIISGIIIGKLKLEHWVEDYVYQIKMGEQAASTQGMNFAQRVEFAKFATKDILKKVWPYVLIAIAIGGFMHGYVPTDFFVKYAGRGQLWAVPFAVVLGIPLYSNAAGVIPIVKVLFEKGVALGTVLAFMMSVTALSLPEMIILRKVLKPKLLATFVGIVGFGILLTGYLFNAIF